MEIVARASREHPSTFALQGVGKMSKRLMVAMAFAVAASPTLAADDYTPNVSFDAGALGVEDVVSWTKKSTPDVKPATDAEEGAMAMFFVAASPNSEAVSEMLSWRWRVKAAARCGAPEASQRASLRADIPIIAIN